MAFNPPMNGSSSSSCYCCNNTRKAMDVDAALDELGLLSTVTNSRKQYLRERIRTRSEPSPTDYPKRSLHIVQIDKTYVNNISSGTFGTFYPSIDPGENVSVDPNSQSSSFIRNSHDQYRETPNSLTSSVSTQKYIRRSLMRKNRYKKPYEVPWRLNQSLPETEIKRDETFPGLSKSNSESPVKGAHLNEHLTRSRSLENIELARTRLLEIFEKVPDAKEKQDMENVSKNLERLHVSDTVS